MDDQKKSLKKFDLVQSKVNLQQRPNYQMQKPEIRLGVIVSDSFTAYFPINHGDENKPFDITDPKSYFECHDMVLVHVYVPGLKVIEAVRLINLSPFSIDFPNSFISYDEANEITRLAIGVKRYTLKIAKELRNMRDGTVK